MKRVLFLLSDLERGGIPRVTLNLIAQLDQGKVLPVVFCGNARGIFLDTVKASGCHVLTGSAFLRAVMCNYSKESFFFRLFAVLIKTIRHALWKVFKFDILTLLNKNIGRMISSKKYDIVIATSEGMPLQWALQSQEPQKILWIHNDYDYQSTAEIVRLEKELPEFDGVICVAEHVRKSFVQCFPFMAGKSVILYNIVNEEEIHNRAGKTQDMEDEFLRASFSILSIGRFNDAPKQFSKIPEICSELVHRGIRSFKWFIIGNGSPAETTIITDAIEKYQMKEYVILLGEKANPYPYLAKCSLYALTSRYEAYPTVINEAQALGTPILSTDFNGVDELIDKNYNGIVPIDQFAKYIEIFIKCQPRQRTNKDFYEHNQKTLQMFYKLVGV